MYHDSFWHLLCSSETHGDPLVNHRISNHCLFLFFLSLLTSHINLYSRGINKREFVANYKRSGNAKIEKKWNKLSAVFILSFGVHFQVEFVLLPWWGTDNGRPNKRSTGWIIVEAVGKILDGPTVCEGDQTWLSGTPSVRRDGARWEKTRLLSWGRHHWQWRWKLKKEESDWSREFTSLALTERATHSLRRGDSELPLLCVPVCTKCKPVTSPTLTTGVLSVFFLLSTTVTLCHGNVLCGRNRILSMQVAFSPTHLEITWRRHKPFS